MKIFVSHSSDFDYEKELYDPLRKSKLFGEHEFFLPHADDRDINTKEEIQSSDLFVAEASHPSTGSGIEIGWAHAANIPILVVYKDNLASGLLRYLTDNLYPYTSH